MRCYPPCKQLPVEGATPRRQAREDPQRKYTLNITPLPQTVGPTDGPKDGRTTCRVEYFITTAVLAPRVSCYYIQQHNYYRLYNIFTSVSGFRPATLCSPSKWSSGRANKLLRRSHVSPFSRGKSRKKRRRDPCVPWDLLGRDVCAIAGGTS